VSRLACLNCSQRLAENISRLFNMPAQLALNQIRLHLARLTLPLLLSYLGAHLNYLSILLDREIDAEHFSSSTLLVENGWSRWLPRRLWRHVPISMLTELVITEPPTISRRTKLLTIQLDVIFGVPVPDERCLLELMPAWHSNT
jgi:hypothetical protein